ncbi:30S ribosomal protein S19 [Porphyridium purpureum]|uniref:30S ribosomal protein S19 n=1 Tax=Porphyridium purpureum TaxID=35688 RepID=A0A5J4Z1F0_PORPP|nr:30S ribosomal protein S19 [Porphyridium purpureum]|eukprot:POR2408..scf295_1
MRWSLVARMPRPVWKGPFADPLVGNPEKGTRRSMILPEWIGKTILVHSGKDWQPVVVNNKMVGHRLGEFVLTKKAVVHQGKLADAQKGSKKK